MARSQAFLDAEVERLRQMGFDPLDPGTFQPPRRGADRRDWSTLQAQQFGQMTHNIRTAYDLASDRQREEGLSW